MRKWNTVIVITALVCFGVLGTGNGQQTSIENSRKLVRKVDPRYPELARKMNLGGTVKVVAVVAPDGSVKNVEPVGGSPLLVEAAQKAITQWKFAAGGESRETVELHFNP
jgi:TonB family protein